MSALARHRYTLAALLGLTLTLGGCVSSSTAATTVKPDLPATRTVTITEWGSDPDTQMGYGDVYFRLVSINGNCYVQSEYVSRGDQDATVSLTPATTGC